MTTTPPEPGHQSSADDGSASEYDAYRPGAAVPGGYPPPGYTAPPGYGQSPGFQPSAYPPPQGGYAQHAHAQQAQPQLPPLPGVAYGASWTPVRIPQGAPVRPPAFVLATVAASLLALIGGILPWFHPRVGADPIPGSDEIHVWQDGRLGVVGPLLVLGVGIAWLVAYLRPKPDADALRRLAGLTVLGGALGLLTLVVLWALVPHNYTDWDAARRYAEIRGLSLRRGPRLGFWLTGVASLADLALGIAAVLTVRRPAAAPPWVQPGGPSAPPYGAAPRQG